MDQDLFAHRTLTDLVEGLDHDGVLGEHLQVGDLKLVLVGLPSRHGLTHELDSFKEVGFVVTMAVETGGWLAQAFFDNFMVAGVVGHNRFIEF